MKREVVLSVAQLYRGQPGGIATYLRGLVGGLALLNDADLDLVGLAPRGPIPDEVSQLAVRLAFAPLPNVLLTRMWSKWPLGVPRNASVVHAPSLAGPFSGGRTTAVHSVALHDMLWRDEPSSSTSTGIRFHERRLELVRQREDVRVLTTSPGLKERLVAEGFTPDRVHQVRLGANDDRGERASVEHVRALLAQHNVVGPFTFYAGTIEPRKNLPRLVAAHRLARQSHPELGQLVLAGPSGWGNEDTGDAVRLGLVEREVLRGLLRDATVVAYVPLAEGWGLPPIEALHAGSRVVASTTTPSVQANQEVELVNPLSVESIANGLELALDRKVDDAARSRRSDSVAEFTWRHSALDHVAAWQ